MCKKRPYNKKDADKVADALCKVYDAPMSAYKCQHGDHYHIGNLPTHVNKLIQEIHNEAKQGKRKKVSGQPPHKKRMGNRPIKNEVSND